MKQLITVLIVLVLFIAGIAGGYFFLRQAPAQSGAYPTDQNPVGHAAPRRESFTPKGLRRAEHPVRPS